MPGKNKNPIETPDGRYIVVDGKLWRRTDPRLSEDERQRLVRRLMTARRAVADAKRRDDERALRNARDEVQAAKEALGERGPVWWDDGAPDYSGRDVDNTPYADWYRRKNKDV